MVKSIGSLYYCWFSVVRSFHPSHVLSFLRVGGSVTASCQESTGNQVTGDATCMSVLDSRIDL